MRDAVRRDDVSCPLCGGESQSFFRSKLEWCVRSDWTPIARSVEVHACAQCGHLFKETASVRASSDYESYHAWNNQTDADKVDFESGAPLTRSAALLTFLREHGALTDGTQVLDFGCNRGALLALLPGRHAGYDVSETYRPIVEGLGHAYYTPKRPPHGSFGLVTLVHVLEHLVDLHEESRHATAALAPSGALAVQVPDIRTQATDVYVADHRHHFSVSTLGRALDLLGCPAYVGPRPTLAGELTAIGRPARPAELAGGASEPAPSELARILERGEDTLHELAVGTRPVVVFGAGLLGSLFASVLGARAELFVDDNVRLHGTWFHGRPVVGSTRLRPCSLVVMAVPPGVAARVGARCRSMGHDVVTPFAPAGPEGAAP